MNEQPSKSDITSIYLVRYNIYLSILYIAWRRSSYPRSLFLEGSF